MLTFFRRIRKGLLGTGEARKYLLYAVGEIALVVIGILIALQINNWNEQKKQRDREVNSLIEISTELQSNIKNLDFIVHSNSLERKRHKSISTLIRHLEMRKAYHDSLSQHFTKVFNIGGITFRNSGYQSLVSIGVDLISNDELRSEIGKLYSYNVLVLDKVGNEMRDDFYHYILDYLREEFIYTTITDEDNSKEIIKPRNYGSLLNNVEFIQSLKVYSPIQHGFLNECVDVLQETKKVLQLIKEELNEK